MKQTIKMKVLFYIIILTSIFGCKNDEKFSEVKKLSEFPKTTFNPTLENKISADKNSIYCSTLLFAWDEIRKEINSPFTISSEYTELNLLNNSKSFINVLKTDEFNSSIEIDGELIKARAEFSKSLPFEFKLQSYTNKLVFDNQKVASFGVNGYSSDDELKIVEIIYYKNDHNFIIKLLPKNKKHEIILFKTEQNFNSMAEMNVQIEKLTKIGNSEITNDKLNWKYYIGEEDELIIPKFDFNIETNFASREGKNFSTKTQNFLIKKAWQRTAFILDESGAEIESEAEIYADSTSVDEELEKPKPKKMIFDKPFLILLKRTDAKNPYFGLWATNTELMLKE